MVIILYIYPTLKGYFINPFTPTDVLSHPNIMDGIDHSALERVKYLMEGRNIELP